MVDIEAESQKGLVINSIKQKSLSMSLGDYCEPPFGKDPGGFPPPGGTTNCRENHLVTSQRDLSLPSADSWNNNGGAGGTGDLHYQEAK